MPPSLFLCIFFNLFPRRVSRENFLFLQSNGCVAVVTLCYVRSIPLISRCDGVMPANWAYKIIFYLGHFNGLVDGAGKRPNLVDLLICKYLLYSFQANFLFSASAAWVISLAYSLRHGHGYQIDAPCSCTIHVLVTFAAVCY